MYVNFTFKTNIYRNVLIFFEHSLTLKLQYWACFHILATLSAKTETSSPVSMSMTFLAYYQIKQLCLSIDNEIKLPVLVIASSVAAH
jgi:hypothetical protein